MELSKTNLTDGNDYFLTAWMDTKVVHMLSTYRPGNNFIVRNSSDLDDKYDKKIRLCRASRPTNIGDYNSGKGGTDLFDQHCSYYRTMVRTKKWLTWIYTHFFMTSFYTVQVFSRWCDFTKVYYFASCRTIWKQKKWLTNNTREWWCCNSSTAKKIHLVKGCRQKAYRLTFQESRVTMT